MSVKVFRGKCANVGNLYFDMHSMWIDRWIEEWIQMLIIM